MICVATVSSSLYFATYNLSERTAGEPPAYDLPAESAPSPGKTIRLGGQ